MSGETVVYQYDSLKRLVEAHTTTNAWGAEVYVRRFRESHRQGPDTRECSDHACGRASGSRSRAYEPHGHGVVRRGRKCDGIAGRNANLLRRGEPAGVYAEVGDGAADWEKYYFWGADGEKMADCNPIIDAGPNPSFRFSCSALVYYAGRLMSTDRLGSTGKHYPYGESRTESTTDKFATYEPDEDFALDYAVNRWYSRVFGRFLTADPYVASAEPGSWNRYGYVQEDPVNRLDPEGLCDVVLSGFRMSLESSKELADFAKSNITGYPYSGSFADGLQMLGEDIATAVALAVLHEALAQDPKRKVNVTTISGGSQAFASAYGMLSDSEKARIGNVNYLIPGNVQNLLPSGTGQTTVVLGTGNDYLFPSDGVLPGSTVIKSSCSHDPDCVIREQRRRLNSLSGINCPVPGQYTRPDVAGPAADIRRPYIDPSARFWWLDLIGDYVPQRSVSPE